MLYGICNLSVIPLRSEASDLSEMNSQVLFGESFKVLDKKKNWSRIRTDFDEVEGFVDNKQYQEITEEAYLKLQQTDHSLAGEFIDYITHKNGSLSTIVLGSTLPYYNTNRFQINDNYIAYDGAVYNGISPKESILKTAYLYLNSPYVWGGKTPFGIDCSGFTQMVYKLCGYAIPRNAIQQAAEGEVLSFIEESDPGDLAFFDDHEGTIIHVGIIMKDNYIIHAHGKVRIDRLDHSGIYNIDTKRHTHKLRVIKKMI